METLMPKSMLAVMLQEAAELGAMSAFTILGVIKPYLSKNEAYRMYGQATVERWIKEGLILFEKDGTTTSKCRIDRIRLLQSPKQVTDQVITG